MNPDTNPPAPNPDQTTPPAVTPAPIETPVLPPQQTAPETQPAPTKASKKKLGLIAVIIAVILLLAGAGAAAYYGVVVPNKPENKLAAAFGNLARQGEATISGSIEFEAKKSTGSVKGAAIDYVAKMSDDKKVFSIAGDVGVSGAKFPYDLRYIDNDIYFRVSGLSSLADLFARNSGAEVKAYSQLLSNIDDQWYVIDRSFMQQAGPAANCIADLAFTPLTDEDVNKIEEAYKKYPLFTIKNTSSEELDGVSVTKYELEPADDEAARKFAGELSSVSLVEKARDCLKEGGFDENELKDLEDESTTGSDAGTFYAYITDDKQVKKLELKVDDEATKADVSMNFDYKGVEVSKPDGAKPIQELLGDLFSGGMTGVN